MVNTADSRSGTILVSITLGINPMKDVLPTTPDYQPLVIVMGRSGFGKSYSMRNLDPETTVVFNTELKPLPFKGGKKFRNVYLEDPHSLLKFFAAAQGKDDVKTIVIDSFSGWTEQLMKDSRQKNKGYDVFNSYNTHIGTFFNALKKSTKQVFLIGHEDVTTLDSGESIIGLKVEGQVWRGVCEKEAVVVLHACMDSDGEGNNTHYFETQSNGSTNAKSPQGMFADFRVDNDLALVQKSVEEYFN